MPALSAVLVCTLVAGAAANANSNGADMELGANPIRKIVTLLQDMQKEIEVEGAKEKELYDKFMCFCNGGADELSKASADAAATIETLSSRGEEDKALKAGLDGDLVKHKADREAAVADLDKATALRNKERAEYEEDSADQKSSFDAISGAIPALEQGMGGASLLQNDGLGKRLMKAVDAAQSISEFEKKDMTAFLEQKAGYSPQSGQIVGILKNMKDEMEKAVKDLDTSEETAARGFADLKAAKEQEVEINSEAIESKTKRTGELAVSIVQAADGVEDATAEKANADKMLSTMDEQCKQKQAEHDERSKMRAEEVQAISEAVTILNDDDALDVFKKSVPSALLQQTTSAARKVGFLQVPNAKSDRLLRAQGIVSTIQAQYKGSYKLDLLAVAMKTQLRERAHGAVDFGQLTKMIDQMVGVLEAEQADDEKHKTWCLGELASAADEESSTQSTIASTTATIAQVSDEISTLSEDIESLIANIAALDKDVATATEQRKQEHAEYLETLQLTETAVQLLGKAKNRLQKFYNPALYVAPKKKELSDEDAIVSRLGGASFVQVAKAHVVLPEAPETASGPYEKKGQKSGGVMALMDMLANELETSSKEAQHDEKTAQTDYTELMASSQATRASDNKSMTDKNAAKADMQSKLVSLKESKSLSVEELENITAYIAELHGSCDFILENFKLRSEARSSEIEGLKNAKAVLSGASYSA